ncbi:MAG TPA: hypothetical protein VH593_02930, partial [Ktedonobacteraceae bacterium]
MTYRDYRARSADTVYGPSHTRLPFAGPPISRQPPGHKPLLLSAFLIGGLLLVFQLGVILLHPSWKIPSTDWLRAVLGWLELIVTVFVSLSLTRMRRPEFRAWWAIS